MRLTTARRSCLGPARVSAVAAFWCWRCWFCCRRRSGRANAQSAAPAQTLATHVGAATCGASTCHSATVPARPPRSSRLNFISGRTGSSLQGFAALSSDRARRIAGNLRVGSPQNAALCLGCHADLVAPARRGANYKVSDGVDCEACHGAASEWLGPHVSGLFNHAEHIAAGMYPTAEPQARAQLCLGCHFGTGDKFVSHRLIAAGHPRLAFDLESVHCRRAGAFPAHCRIQAAQGRRHWRCGLGDRPGRSRPCAAAPPCRSGA